MTGEEMLVEMIRSNNEDVLEKNGIDLKASMLNFTDLYPGSYDGGANTKISATSKVFYIEGNQTYYYTRPDMTQAFIDVGIGTPDIAVDGDPTLANVVTALRRKYNFQVQLENLRNFEVDGNSASFDVVDDDFVWTGSLTVMLDSDSTDLAIQFPNNVLNGFVKPSGTPLTDGGNYDQLTS